MLVDDSVMQFASETAASTTTTLPPSHPFRTAAVPLPATGSRAVQPPMPPAAAFASAQLDMPISTAVMPPALPAQPAVHGHTTPTAPNPRHAQMLKTLREELEEVTQDRYGQPNILCCHVFLWPLTFCLMCDHTMW